MKRSLKILSAGLSAVLLGSQMMPVWAEEEMTAEVQEESAVVMEIAQADNAFGKVLMAELAKDGENVFISPYSIATALSMLGHASESGEQIEEIWQLLGYDALSEEEILAGQQDLMDMVRPGYGMEPLPESIEGMSEEEMERLSVGTVEIANAFYVDDEVQTVDAFEELKELLTGYQAEVDVKALETEQTMNEVNEWVKEKTHEMIESLLDEPMSRDVAMLLMNTVYFKGKWMKSFTEDFTDTQTFYGRNGETEVSMMHQQSRFPYVETDEYQVISLPYQADYEMRIYLPKDTETCEKWSDAEYLQALSEIEFPEKSREVLLSLPKFELEYSRQLKDVLKNLGVMKIFDGYIYDRVCNDLLGVGSILHKTALKNHENGTEAAAVTAIFVMTMAMREPEEPVEMMIDRPFYFTITHKELGLNLFEGCIYNLEESVDGDD